MPDQIRKANIDELTPVRKAEHPGYTHDRRHFVKHGERAQMVACVYELQPGNAMCPYHYHLQNEELFYIISGTGLLRTPEGEEPVGPGDLIYFPANENGAHKLLNTSETEVLRYLDVDTNNAVDLCFYPDSGKLGIWGSKHNAVYMQDDTHAYWDGE